MGLDTMEVADCVRLINSEDAAVIEAVRLAGPELTVFIAAAEPGFVAGGRMIYFGAGTSGRLGVLDASEAPPTFAVPADRIIGIIAGGDESLRTSSEGREDEPEGVRAELEKLKLTEHDAVLGIAAGGTTPYVVGGVAAAKSLCPGCITGMLVCTTMAKPAAADHLIVLNTGPEVLTGSTRMKAGSATKMALNTISTTLMVRSGRVYENLMVDVKASNAKLVDRAVRTIGVVTGLGREPSLELLKRADGRVKAAVIMHRLGVSLAEADARSDAAGGKLRRVIG